MNNKDLWVPHIYAFNETYQLNLNECKSIMLLKDLEEFYLFTVY